MQRWTDDQLREAVAASRSVSQTLRLLGLRPVGGNYDTIRRRVRDLTIDTSHWGRTHYRAVERSVVERAVSESWSIAAALAHIGWPSTTTTRRRFQALVQLYGLNLSHFTGQATSRGKRYPERVKPANYYLQLDGPRIPSTKLRRKLLQEGIFAPACAICGTSEWRGCPVPLELEHKNGNRYDNRLENLALLCPNCHALTPTYRGRNIGRYSDESA